MDEGEVFDLNSISEYELLSNEDGTVLIQDNCVVIKHKQTAEIKMLPLSDEVLQALGLALVLEDEDVKKDNSNVQIHMEETMEEPENVLQEFMIQRVPEVNQSQQETAQSDEEDNDSQNDGSNLITFMFTDDEDGEMDKSQEEDMEVDDNTSQGKGACLVWSGAMVEALLDLYEELQPRFLASRNHKPLWHDIYVRLCAKFPDLSKWSDLQVQSKFNGLKRTYKGAALYLKENMHTTKWVHFDRMKRIMDKSGADTEGDNYSAEFRKTVNETGERKKESPNLIWKRKWTLRMLDVYGAACGAGQRGAGAVFWSAVRDQVVASCPDFEAVSAEQLKRKLFGLKRMFRIYKARPQLKLAGEFKDSALYERVAKICEKDTNSDSEEAAPEERGPQQWSRAQTDMLLDLCHSAPPGARSEIIEEVSNRMRQQFGATGDFSPAKCQQKLSSLRHHFTAIIEKKPPGTWKNVTWPFFDKCMKIFHSPAEIWSRGNTLLLIELYARVRRYLDEHGDRFWPEVADKFKQQRPGLAVSPRKCEAKMQALFARYKASLKREPAARADQWPLFTKMDSIFGLGSSDLWPAPAQLQMLTLYQQRLHLLEAADAAAVFTDIADIMAKMFPRIVFTAEICQQRLLELKKKYVKLMHEGRPATAWPLYSRMSEIFSSNLWSKANVNHLLDAYEEALAGGSVGSGAAQGGAGPLWTRVAANFTKRAPAGAAGAHQCRTEFNVLRARYQALANDPFAEKQWPFYERMQKLFNKENSHNQTVGVEKRDKPPYQTIITSMGHIKVELVDNNRHQITVEPSKQAPSLNNSQAAEATDTSHTDDARSPRSDDSDRDSIADKLEELLVEKPAKRRKTVETPPPQPEQEEEEEEVETPTRISTRSVQQKVEWSEEETLELIAAYSSLRAGAGGRGGGDTARTWTGVYKRARPRLAGRKTAGHCAERINALKAQFRAAERSGKRDGEMEESVYLKMKALFELTHPKPKENGTPGPAPTPAETTEKAETTKMDIEKTDSALLQKLLHELESKREYQRQRTECTKKYYEEKSKRDEEKLKVLKNIEQSLSKLLHNDASHKVIIETLEDCLNA